MRDTDESYDFSLREIQTYEVIREVESASCDVGIIAIKDGDFDVMRRYLQKRGIEFTEFLKVPPHVFVRCGHSLAERPRLSYEDLKDHERKCPGVISSAHL